MARVRIIEHTTGESPYCVVEELDGEQRSGEFFGSIDEFREENPHVEIVEEVWS